MSSQTRGYQEGLFALLNSRKLPALLDRQRVPTPRLPHLPHHRHRAGLVVRLAGVGVEGGMREIVHLRVMHRDEDLAALDGRREIDRDGDFPAARADGHRVAFLEAELAGVGWLDRDR